MLKKGVAAVMLLGLGVARAAEPGFYAGAAIGQNTMKESEFGISFSGNDTAFKLFGGYQFNPNIALEGAYIDGGSPRDNFGTASIELDGSAFQAALRGIWPFNDKIAGYLRGGILFWDATATARQGFTVISVDADGNEFSWGAGLEFNIGGAKGRVEYEGADLDGTDFRLISLGFAWFFR